jgi:hypothetical protein
LPEIPAYVYFILENILDKPILKLYYVNKAMF